MCFLFLQSEGSNSDKAFHRGEKKAKFKLLFASTSVAKYRGALGVTAIQRIELIAGKAQDSIIVHPISNELYEPRKLDEKMKQSKYWTSICSMMKDILPLTKDEDEGHWIWNESKPFESFEYQSKYKIIVIAVMYEGMSIVYSCSRYIFRGLKI